MVLTASQAIDHIRHTLYDADSSIPPIEIVNSAGQLLFGMRSWNFKRKGPATLNFVSGQEYIELPSDLEEIDPKDIQATNSLTTNFNLVTAGEILDLRTQSIGNPKDFWGTIVWEIPSGGTAIAPRLEIYPTPTANQTDALTYFYRSKWVNVADDDATLTQIIPAVETLYKRICRQLARSYEDEDAVSYNEALNSLEGSLEYRIAVHGDVGPSKSQGIMRNGVATHRSRGSFWDRTVKAPL